MARAEHILVNVNPYMKDTNAINQFTNEHLFNNILIKNHTTLVKESNQIDIDERYDYRPDKLAYEIYGEDFYYPAILIANNLGSLLQFKAEIMNYKCLVPKAAVVRSILGSGEYDDTHRFTTDVIEDIFQDVQESTTKYFVDKTS